MIRRKIHHGWYPRREILSVMGSWGQRLLGLEGEANFGHPPVHVQKKDWRGGNLDVSKVKDHDPDVNPFQVISGELEEMSSAVHRVVSVIQHPVLHRAASYFFSATGKRVRPTMVFLMAHATAHAPRTTPATNGEARGGLLSSQKQLAGITEMIHTASLLHDDVIDVSDTRRGLNSVNSVFGNQLAVLAGDFLLARASVSLARLRNCDVIELLSTVIEHLVRGEVLQLRQHDVRDVTESFDLYLKKTFFKTASLIANSCQAAAILAMHEPEICQIAFEYGRNVGMAFQLVDDALDMRGTSGTLGKPVGADLRAGVVNAPLLYAIEDHPQLIGMIARKFSNPGDIEYARQCIESSQGVDQTMAMACRYAEIAVEEVSRLPPSLYRSGLINLAVDVLTRSR